MKGIAIVALLFALGSVGAAGYGYIETKPNHDALQAEVAKPEASTIEVLLADEYAKTLGRLCIVAWATALIAIICGAIATKKRAKGMGVTAIILALAGAGVAVAMMPQPLKF